MVRLLIEISMLGELDVFLELYLMLFEPLQFPKLLFADEIRVNMTLLSDPENRRGYGTGVIDATSPYRVECEYTPRKDRSPEPFCSEQHALTYKLNSEGGFNHPLH